MTRSATDYGPGKRRRGRHRKGNPAPQPRPAVRVTVTPQGTLWQYGGDLCDDPFCTFDYHERKRVNLSTADLFRQSTLDKAERLLRADGVKADPEHPRAIWWVGSVRDAATTYRVQADLDDRGNFTWLTCTCPHGLNSGGGQAACYHAAAALMFAEGDLGPVEDRSIEHEPSATVATSPLGDGPGGGPGDPGDADVAPPEHDHPSAD